MFIGKEGKGGSDRGSEMREGFRRREEDELVAEREGRGLSTDLQIMVHEFDLLDVERVH